MQPRAPSARVRQRGRADAGRVGPGDPHPHRHRRHHRRQRQEFILWSDTLGVSMLVDALANPLPARRDRVDGARAVLRPRRRRCASTARASPASPRASPPGCTGACSTSTARRSPAPSSTSGRTATTSCTRYRARGARGPSPWPFPHARDGTLRVPRRTPGAVHDPRRRSGRARCSPRPAGTPGAPRTST